MVKPSGFFILGAGGHGAVIADIAQASDISLMGFIDVTKAGGRHMDLPIYAGLDQVEAKQLVIAIGDNFKRQQVAEQVKLRAPNLEFPSLIHPKASVAQTASIGSGTVVMAGAVVGPKTTVGDFCILNHRASLDHDCLMADYASLAPGAVTGGGVHIGNRTAISLAASVKHGVVVGNDTVIGANAYLNKDLGDGWVAYGSPAKPVRRREPGEAYL